MPNSPSLLFLRLDLRLEESRGACCGDVSPEVPEDGLLASAACSWFCSISTYPALDIAAAELFLPFFRTSSGESRASNLLSPPRGLLVFRVSRWACGGASAEALRLRVMGERCIGGDPVSVAEEGVVLSALSLAAEARVTLCDMGK